MSVVPPVELSAGAARRIAVAAQGFGAPRSAGVVTARQINRAIEAMGILQLDSVNVLSRSHYLPLYSRLGPYPREVLDRLTGHTDGRITRKYVEYWAHEASLIPLATHPLLRWRMATAADDAWGPVQRIARERPHLIDEVRALVESAGPIRSNQTGIERPARAAGDMWNWHDGKVALEYLFWSGEIGAARRVNFERHYDLIERVLPPEVHGAPTPRKEDAQRELVRIAARAYGVATEPDLGDYFRLPRADSKLRVAELVAAGELLPVTIRGWRAPAYLWPAARRPRIIRGRALLSPFDPLVWFRDRALRLFDFHYRIEIYTPAAKRVFGYYVLPFLLGDRLVARVDLKADRQTGALLVQSAWRESGTDSARGTGGTGGSGTARVDEEYVATELAAELWQLARWLGLDSVIVNGTGDLAGALTVQVKLAA